MFLGAAVAGAMMVAAGTIYQASAADSTNAPPAMQADAGPDGAPPDAGMGAAPDMGPGMGPGMMRHGGPDGGPGAWHHHGMKDHDMFGLFARDENKNLTVTDVKVIAQAILLEHGKHDWTVANVSQTAGAIDFSYTTPHGDVVATFAVDPKSGHIKRIG